MTRCRRFKCFVLRCLIFTFWITDDGLFLNNSKLSELTDIICSFALKFNCLRHVYSDCYLYIGDGKTVTRLLPRGNNLNFHKYCWAVNGEIIINSAYMNLLFNTLFFYARISRKASKRANGTQNKPVSMRCNYSDILSFAVTCGFSQPSKRIYQKGPVAISQNMWTCKYMNSWDIDHHCRNALCILKIYICIKKSVYNANSLLFTSSWIFVSNIFNPCLSSHLDSQQLDELSFKANHVSDKYHVPC